MTAVDTNVLVRIVVNDDPAQSVRAAEFIRRQDRVFLSKTVLLELEWVLRSGYRLKQSDILAVFRRILGMGNVDIEDETTVLEAMRCYEKGMDFADSLHLVTVGPHRSFATFDVALHRIARRHGIGKTTVL
jgi:predicted nucleic-acid-binding protein